MKSPENFSTGLNHEVPHGEIGLEPRIGHIEDYLGEHVVHVSHAATAGEVLGHAIAHDPILSQFEGEVEFVPSRSAEEFVPLSEQEIARQRKVAKEAVDASNYDHLKEFLLLTPQIDNDALVMIIRKMQGLERWIDYEPGEGGLQETVDWINMDTARKIAARPLEDQPPLVNEMVKGDGYYMLLEHVKNGEVDSSLVDDALMRSGRSHQILHDISHFPDVDRKVLFEALCADGHLDSLIYNIDAVPGINKKEVFDKAIEERLWYPIMYKLEYFMDVIDKDEFVATLFREKQEYMIVDKLHLFPDIDKTELILRCCKDSTVYFKFGSEDFLTGVDFDRVLEELLSQEDYYTLLENIDVFPGIDTTMLIDKMIECGRGYDLARTIGTHPAFTEESLFDRLVEGNHAGAIMYYLDRFPGADVNLVARLAIDQGSAAEVINRLSRTPGLDRKEVADLVIASGYGYLLFNVNIDAQMYRDDIPELSDTDLQDLFLKHRRYADLVHGLGCLPGADEEKIVQSLLEAFANENVEFSEKEFGYLNDYLMKTLPQNELPESLLLTNRYMGTTGATLAGFEIIRTLQRGGEPPFDARAIGVTRTGVAGMEQFGVAVQAISTELRAVDFTPDTIDKLQDFALYRGILEKIYRVSEAEFGDRSSGAVTGLLNYYEQQRVAESVVPMHEEYVATSREITTLESEKEKVEITEEARRRFVVLRNDALSAIEYLRSPHAFSHLMQDMGNRIEDASIQLQHDLHDLAEAGLNDRASEFKMANLQSKREALEGLLENARQGKYVGRHFVLKSPEDFSQVFDQLEAFDELHGTMRQLVFAWALRKNPQMAENIKNSSSEASLEGIETMRSFVEQIVNNETFENYFTSKKIATKFKKLTSVKALDDALVRHQALAKGGAKQRLEIIPTRGFAMELSGHVADACWASKYDSIAEKFPNITTIFFKRGEAGSGNERLVGSALLIETKDASGEPVLAVRGINPIENYINKVRVEEFYNFVTDYTRETAKKRGMRPAVVIDRTSSMAGTNRPALHEYEVLQRQEMQPIIIEDPASTFNDYDITNITYAL